MYLKQLELNGFKSFAERTVFAFGPGITAIVGPNGAGKSNVADAIRWVLGEQNPRLLRGTRMEDVIFNGSEGRRPLGLAEVLLTLDNSDGALPTEFTEVTVGRRVDRAGGSDYLINGSSCRLRDVQELFYDTGLGREAYSLVGQGRVDEVLAARPEERRALLEEAAGIVRFKARKQEALRRLASVEERLVRLGDILGEIEARLGPLEAAAKQARRHRQLLAELRSVELRLERWLWVRALARWRDKHRQVEALRTEQQTWRHELETTSRRLVDLRRQLAERERDLEAARTAFEQSAGQWEQLRARRQVLAERRRGLAQRLDQLQQEHAALEAERAEHTRRVSGEQAQQAELEQRVQEHGGKRKELEQALAAAEALHAELEQALARARQDVLAALGETAEAEKRRARDEARLQAIRTQREQLDAALTRWQEQWASLAERHRHCSQELAQQRERAQAALAQAQELESRRRRLAAVGERAQQRLMRLQERLADARGRVRLLESLQQNYEGFYGGVRTVLRGRDRGEPAFADVIGVVAELITTPAGYQAALEAALAGALQYVVVRTGDGAQRAIEELRRRRAGRVTFLPLDGLRAGDPHEADAALLRLDGVIGWAVDLVGYPAEIHRAVQHLLGRVLVTRDLTAARRAARASGYRLRVVTLEGDVVHAGGAISGGSEAGRRLSLLNRRLELDEVRRQVGRLEAAAGSLARRHQRLRRLLASADEQRQERREEAARWRHLEASSSRELAALTEQRRRLEQEGERLEREQAELTAQEAALERELAGYQAAVGDQGQRLTEARRRVEQLEGERQQHQARVAEVRTELAQVAAAHEALRAQLETLQQWQQRAAQERQRLEERWAAIERERHRLVDELERCDAEDAELANTEERFRQERERAYQRLQELKEQRQAYMQQVADLEAAIDQKRRHHDEVAQRLQQGEVEEARLRLEVDQLQRRLREEFGLEVDEAEALGGQAGDEQEGNALRAQARRLRQQLEGLGPVNPAAEDEYRSVRERYRFLRSQTDDLIQARARLRELLEQIDQTMERRFTDTFEELRSRFRSVFSRLFGGGRADLVLLAASDDAPAGIDILAQPPGKKLQPLSLLSGGERALTAIALLFALLEIKPAPFCVVDEVDAALDDANLERFAAYLKELSARMQFIVITHQKATMAVADTLYGIVLGDGGVSRSVAVRLDQVAAAVSPA